MRFTCLDKLYTAVKGITEKDITNVELDIEVQPDEVELGILPVDLQKLYVYERRLFEQVTNEAHACSSEDADCLPSLLLMQSIHELAADVLHTEMVLQYPDLLTFDGYAVRKGWTVVGCFEVTDESAEDASEDAGDSAQDLLLMPTGPWMN